jgi:hypothetical protein
MAIDKKHILDEIKRTAAKNEDGVDGLEPAASA